MAVFIDPPLWPAHGTVFSHLISDASLAELHDFAASAGVPARAFDQDHYDVPSHRYPELVRLGAVEVSGGELVRILIGSGLRVPARKRPGRLRSALQSRWNAVLPGTPGIGAELLQRWSEPHRKYHTPEHLLAVLEALDALMTAQDSSLRRPVLLAAWFHDAVYRGVAGGDEADSAALAERALAGAGLPRHDIDEVSRLVLLTVTHAPDPGDRAGALLCDADLSVLGSPPARYSEYLRAVRAEYASVLEADFAAGRAKVLQRLLAIEPLFSTAEGSRLWSGRARANLSTELAALAQAAGRAGAGETSR